MLKKVLITLSLLIFSTLAMAGLDLTIVGKTVLVVKELPFKVVAPTGADFYVWTLPNGVEGDDSDNVMTITKAPVGEFVIKVRTLTFDEKTHKKIKDAGEVTVYMGKMPTPTPGPTPTPDDALNKSILDAVSKDVEGDKVALVNKLGQIYRIAGKETVHDPSLKTAGAVDEVVRNTAQSILGKLTIPNTRDACGKYLSSVLPKDKATPLDDQLRQKYSSAFLSLASSLENIK